MTQLVCELVLPYCDPLDIITLSRAARRWRVLLRSRRTLQSLLSGVLTLARESEPHYRIVSHIANVAIARRYVGAIDLAFYDELTYVINSHMSMSQIFPAMLMMSPHAVGMLREQYNLLYWQKSLILSHDGEHFEIARVTMIIDEFGCMACLLPFGDRRTTAVFLAPNGRVCVTDSIENIVLGRRTWELHHMFVICFMTAIALWLGLIIFSTWISASTIVYVAVVILSTTSVLAFGVVYNITYCKLPTVFGASYMPKNELGPSITQPCYGWSGSLSLDIILFKTSFWCRVFADNGEY